VREHYGVGIESVEELALRGEGGSSPTVHLSWYEVARTQPEKEKCVYLGEWAGIVGSNKGLELAALRGERKSRD